MKKYIQTACCESILLVEENELSKDELGLCYTCEACNSSCNVEFVDITKVEEKIQQYISKNGSGELQDLVALFEKDGQFREAVNADYELFEYDEWKHFQQLIGTDIKYSTFEIISSALWEEDIQIIELPYTKNTNENYYAGIRNVNHWKEIRNEHFDEIERCVTIDGWLTANDDEAGSVIAKIYVDGNKDIEYLDKRAETDNNVQEMIQEVKNAIAQGTYGKKTELYICEDCSRETETAFTCDKCKTEMCFDCAYTINMECLCPACYMGITETETTTKGDEGIVSKD